MKGAMGWMNGLQGVLLHGDNVRRFSRLIFFMSEAQCDETQNLFTCSEMFGAIFSSSRIRISNLASYFLEGLCK